jgi:carbonic anhydrase
MDRLIDGYRRFRAEVWPAERDRYEALAVHGQSPHTLVIACSDSRVDPQTVFGMGPGELFVVRNVAGLIPPYSPDAGYHGTSAALEYAVRVLKVKRIVVLGHGRCGGVHAMVEGAPLEAKDFVEPWMSMAQSVLRPHPDVGAEDRLTFYEREVVKLSLRNARTFPWVEEAEAAGALMLRGFRFGIHSGVLEQLEDDAFIPVDGA